MKRYTKVWFFKGRFVGVVFAFAFNAFFLFFSSCF